MLRLDVQRRKYRPYQYIVNKTNKSLVFHSRVQRGAARGPDQPTLENHKNMEFLSKTGPHPLNYHKAAKPAFQQLVAIPTYILPT